ncbi:MAG: radical SAM protein [Roseobacter sp.]
MDGAPTNDERYIEINHSDPKYARIVVVDWMLGNSCNYACSYCPTSLHDGSVRWQKTDDIFELYDQMQKHYVEAGKKLVWLQFTGGEPTMHPRIIDLLKRASDLGFKVSLISNGSRTMRFWEKIRGCLDNVILTYHNEFAHLDHFIKVGQMLSEQMVVHINITMHPDRFDQTVDEAKELRAALPAASISLKPLRVDFQSNLYEYSDDQKRILGQSMPPTQKAEGDKPRAMMRASTQYGQHDVLRGNDFILRGINRWKGYMCNVGLESLRVKGTGEVYRGVCAVGGRIGYLGEKIDLPRIPIRCSKDSCSCLADILTSKQLNEGDDSAVQV